MVGRWSRMSLRLENLAGMVCPKEPIGPDGGGSLEAVVVPDAGRWWASVPVVLSRRRRLWASSPRRRRAAASRRLPGNGLDESSPSLGRRRNIVDFGLFRPQLGRGAGIALTRVSHTAAAVS